MRGRVPEITLTPAAAIYEAVADYSPTGLERLMDKYRYGIYVRSLRCMCCGCACTYTCVQYACVRPCMDM